MTPSYFRIGGLMMDLPAGFENRVQSVLDDFPDALNTFDTLVTGNTIWQSRTKGIGIISTRRRDQLGPDRPVPARQRRRSRSAARQSVHGLRDLRFRYPDRAGRRRLGAVLVRMRECYESHKIVRQALDRLKPGPIKADAPKVVLPDRDDMRKHMDSLIHHFLIVAEGFNVPPGEVYMPIEASKGELGVYMKSNGGPKPERVHFRGPSFVNLSALPVMSEGEMIADVVAIIGSLDIVLGEIDR